MRRRPLGAVFTALFALVFVALGLLVVAGGWRMIENSRTLAERGVRTTGQVVDTAVTSSTDSDGHTTYTKHMRVRFTTPDGWGHLFWTDGKKKVGKNVKVTYDPRNPELVVTGKPSALKTEGVVGIVFGVAFTLFSCGWFWSAVRLRW